jgi:hypothetical protein
MPSMRAAAEELLRDGRIVGAVRIVVGGLR